MTQRATRWLKQLWRRFCHQRSYSQRGDMARGHQRWRQAARHYRRHLALHAGDHAIWIQLGHAHKEAGRLPQAEDAYRRAMALGAADENLLLHLGYLLKRMGRSTDAMHVLSEHLAIHFDPALLNEIQQLSLRSGHGETVNEGDALELLVGASCKGLRIVASHELLAQADDTLRSTGIDPWIEFVILPDYAAFPAVRLVIGTTWPNEPTPPRGRLYINYGDGYDERHAISIRGDRRRVNVLLAAPGLIKRLRWDPDERESCFTLDELSLQAVDPDDKTAEVRRVGLPNDAACAAALQALEELHGDGCLEVERAAQLQKRLTPTVDLGLLYDHWLDRYVTPDATDYEHMVELTAAMPTRPSFSFVIPVYNTPPLLLRACVESMLAQVYPDFEICLADDCSSDPAIGEILAEYERRDRRVKVSYRTVNGHISAASNSALAMARGDFVVLVDHDDVIPEYALLVVTDVINANPDASIFFSDEDKIDMEGHRHSPYFKGAFDRFLMYGHNMVSHLGVYRRSLLNEISGFREGLEGSQDYDLFLRGYELVGDAGVVHIPHVLYHWRTTPGSTAISPDQKGYAFIAAQRSINDHFQRTGQPLRSVDGVVPGLAAVAAVAATQLTAMISVIICTRDRHDLLRTCIESLLGPRPERVEIIVVDNDSNQPETLQYLAKLKAAGHIKVIAQPGEFNFSALNNAGASEAQGDLLCFLNNDTEATGASWFDRARLLLSMPDVGVVGARLLFPSGNVQHFGIGLGMAQQRVAGVLHVKSPGDDPGYFGKARLLQQFSAVTAACMFVRRQDFMSLGGFDPALAVAYNDVDLCLRYRSAGFRVLCDPEIQLVHKESESRGADIDPARLARLDCEAEIMRDRWGATLDNDPFLSPNQDLGRSHFALAYPPRVSLPWRRSAASEAAATVS